MTESLSQTQLIEDTNCFGKNKGATSHANDDSNNNNNRNCSSSNLDEIYNSNTKNNHFVVDNHNSSNGTSLRSTSSTVSKISSPSSPSSIVIYTVVLKPFNSQFPVKTIEINQNEKCRIGRQSSAKTVPRPLNGYFNSKVLSRNHALLWSDNEDGGVWIKDTKSSNGTFLNGQRLSAELEESEPFELKTGDKIEFGIDITGDNGAILYHKVACSVSIFNLPMDQMDRSTLKEFNLDSGWISEMDESQRRSSISSVSTISEPSGKTTITKHSSKPVAKQNEQWEQLLANLEVEWHRSQDVEKELLGLKDVIGEMNNTHHEDRIKKLNALNTTLHSQLDKAHQQLDEYTKKSRLQDQVILAAKKQLLVLRQSSQTKTKSRNAGMDGSNGKEWQRKLEDIRLAMAEEQQKHIKDLEVEKTRCSELEQKYKILESQLLVQEQGRYPTLIKSSQQNHQNTTLDLADALQIRSVQILIGVMIAIISSLVYALL